MTGVTSSPFPSPALTASIEHVYRVFGPYPLRRHVEGCPCGCLPPAAAQDLYTAPLRNLTAQQLARFSTKAMTTWGDEADFKHFLLRLLELIALGKCAELQILLGKLTYGRWRLWPKREHAAVTSFLHAWWDDVLAREPLVERWEPGEVATILEGLAQAEHDLMPYLTRWAQTETPSAVQHLAALVFSEVESLVQGKLRGAFWAGREAQAQQVMSWLLNGQQQARLEAAAQKANCTPAIEQEQHASE